MDTDQAAPAQPPLHVRTSILPHAAGMGSPQVTLPTQGSQPRLQGSSPTVPETPFEGTEDQAAEPVVRPPLIEVPPAVEALMGEHLEFLRRQGGCWGCMRAVYVHALYDCNAGSVRFCADYLN